MRSLKAYEDMTWETPSDELADAVENLLAEVKRLREGIEDATYDFLIVNEELEQHLKELIE